MGLGSTHPWQCIQWCWNLVKHLLEPSVIPLCKRRHQSTVTDESRVQSLIIDDLLLLRNISDTTVQGQTPEYSHRWTQSTVTDHWRPPTCHKLQWCRFAKQTPEWWHRWGHPWKILQLWLCPIPMGGEKTRVTDEPNLDRYRIFSYDFEQWETLGCCPGWDGTHPCQSQRLTLMW